VVRLRMDDLGCPHPMRGFGTDRERKS
jgi:hypothetical protein